MKTIALKPKMTKNIAYVPQNEFKELYGAGTIQKSPYVPSYYEWLFKNSEQSAFYGVQSGTGNATVYTVPLGYSFFITSFTLSGSQNGAADFYPVDMTLRINVSTGLKYLGALRFSMNGNQFLSQNYSFPFKVNENELIILGINATNSVAFATIQGFLVKNAIIPSNSLI